MHALRHFYASSLLDAGESIKALSGVRRLVGPLIVPVSCGYLGRSR
jgi:hypothetical protein